MSNKKWEIGDLLKYEGRDGVVFGIVINKHGHKYYEVQWFDGEESLEREDAENINIEVISY